MATDQGITTSLLPILQNALDNQTRAGISARTLYAFLELAPGQYPRWSKKNIEINPYAMEHEDWERDRHDVENSNLSHETTVGGRHRTTDYILSIPLAKKLSMMARSAKGEEARLYFLTCEHHAQQPILPKLHDPTSRAIMHLVIENDATKYRLACIEAEHVTQQEALITQQARMIETYQLAQQADAKSTLAIDYQRWVTIRQYRYANKLESQLPDSLCKAYGLWLTNHCIEQGIPVEDKGVADRQWGKEHAYPVEIISQTLPGWLTRAYSQLHLVEAAAP